MFKADQASTCIDGLLVHQNGSLPSDLACMNEEFSSNKLVLGAKWENGLYPAGGSIWEMNRLYDEFRI